MKHIIIEGTDQTGKTTLINNLLNAFINPKVEHFTNPKGNTNDEKTQHQKKSFVLRWSNVILTRRSKSQCDAIFWDRSHLGEFVYGPMYRNSDASWIFPLEEISILDSCDKTILILLECNTELLQSNDDGKSLSQNDSQQIEKEKLLFREAFNKSNIQLKFIVKVSENGKFRSQQSIAEQVKKIINNAKCKED